MLSERSRRIVLALVLFVGWSLVAASCAGIVAMSGAHTESGDWPIGATIALVVVAAVWVIIPVGLLARRRASRSHT